MKNLDIKFSTGDVAIDIIETKKSFYDLCDENSELGEFKRQASLVFKTLFTRDRLFPEKNEFLTFDLDCGTVYIQVDKIIFTFNKYSVVTKVLIEVLNFRIISSGDKSFKDTFLPPSITCLDDYLKIYG